MQLSISKTKSFSIKTLIKVVKALSTFIQQFSVCFCDTVKLQKSCHVIKNVLWRHDNTNLECFPFFSKVVHAFQIDSQIFELKLSE